MNDQSSKSTRLELVFKKGRRVIDVASPDIEVLLVGASAKISALDPTTDNLKQLQDSILQLIQSGGNLVDFVEKYEKQNNPLKDAFDEAKATAKTDKAPMIFVSMLKGIVESLKDELFQNSTPVAESGPKIDLTLPGVRNFTGGLHPLTTVLNEVIDIFRGLGFTVETGPEAELISYNFDKLNTPPWHPARDLTDTFYLDTPVRDRLLRTETSPVQIRVMESRKPPIRIVAPGRVYRSDKPDATHSPIFMQIEGLFVDKGVTFADLKGTVLAFYQSLYGKQVKIRFRPHFFPFTEPSAEVDVTCIFCGGKGCRICKQSGWLEMGGSGMVDPNVFKGVGIDPEVYSGWAFGLGIERIAILRYGVDDIRLFYENDVRFLSQF